MGTLYLGHKTGAHGFTHPVAIKLAHHGDDDEHVEMFVREARISSLLRHPNIVRVEDFGEEAGTLYLVMEYVPGCALHELLRDLGRRRQRFPVALAVHIASKTAEALHAVHTAVDDRGAPLGLVHRDVNPPNILLSNLGEVKLCDFGIVKARDQSSQGGLKGKFGYMSPEQAHGRPLDARSDVYALGVVLWEMLAQRRLLRGRTDIDTLQRARAPEVPDIQPLNPQVPDALSSVLSGALAIDPDDRYPTARAMAEALHAAMEPSPGVTRELEQLVASRGRATPTPSSPATPASTRTAPTSTRPPAWEAPPPPEEASRSVARPASRRPLLALGLLGLLGGLTLAAGLVWSLERVAPSQGSVDRLPPAVSHERLVSQPVPSEPVAADVPEDAPRPDEPAAVASPESPPEAEPSAAPEVTAPPSDAPRGRRRRAARPEPAASDTRENTAPERSSEFPLLRLEFPDEAGDAR